VTAPALAFEGLAGGYGDTRVLRGVDGVVAAGEVLGVIGRNGVGKTTLVRLLTGQLRPMAGTVRLRGMPIDAWPTFARQRAGIACMPQERLVFDPLTVRENLTLHRRDRRLDAYAPLFDAFPRLRERLALPAGRLSGGEKKLVAFARTLAESAPVTVLDEPTEGVQQENIDRMAALVTARCRAGAAFVIVEQNLGFLMGLMHQVVALDHGEVVAAGPAAGFDRQALERHLHV
jgi:ABC-type branched-subunit amino acid transport system ATPase component